MERLSARKLTLTLREVEDIVLELDDAISKNSISNPAFDKLKSQFDRLANELGAEDYATDNRLYIVSEAKALFSWISGDKDRAVELAEIAASTKGDKHLFSRAAKGLVAGRNIKTLPTTDSDDHPTGGWLGFFYLTVTLVFICFLLPAIAYTVGALYGSGINNSWAVAIIWWLVCLLPFSYLILAVRRSKLARPIAIALFGLLTLSCIFILFYGLTYGEYVHSAGSAVAVGIFLFLIGCGAGTTIYYLRSARVRSIFTR